MGTPARTGRSPRRTTARRGMPLLWTPDEPRDVPRLRSLSTAGDPHTWQPGQGASTRSPLVQSQSRAGNQCRPSIRSTRPGCQLAAVVRVHNRRAAHRRWPVVHNRRGAPRHPGSSIQLPGSIHIGGPTQAHRGTSISRGVLSVIGGRRFFGGVSFYRGSSI